MIRTATTINWAFMDLNVKYSNTGFPLSDADGTSVLAATLRQNEERFGQMIDALPTAIYTTDAEGYLTHFNPACVQFAGRTPVVGVDKWCISWKLEETDGAFLPHDECSMAVAIKEDRPMMGAEAVAVRPDGTRRIFQAYPTPLHDDGGRLTGAINMLVDITGKRQGERLMAEQNKLLHLFAKGGSMEKCLTMLTSAISLLEKSTRAVVLIADETGTRFEYGYSAHVPPSFIIGMHDSPVGDAAIGTCGAAVYSGKAVACEDIKQSKKWSKSWRELCVSHGIFACHSQPVVNSRNRRVASLMLCFDEPRKPTPWEMQLALFGSHMASLAIERARAEERLRRAAALDAFRVRLNDSLQSLTDPEEIQSAAATVLGEHLKADRALYASVDVLTDSYTITDNYVRKGLPKLTGSFAISSYGGASRNLRQGGVFVVNDVASDERLEEGEKSVLANAGIGSFIVLSLVKNGQWLSIFGVHSAAARLWKADEVAMVGETAERTWAAAERARAEGALRKSEIRLAEELADAKQLQHISSRLVHQDDIGLLYEKIVDAAVAIMRSDMGSMQMLLPGKKELLLLAWRGFNPESAASWKSVGLDSTSICSKAFAEGKRVVVPDLDACAFRERTADFDFYHLSEVRAVQSTPLVTRSGKIVGMISNHWTRTHEPTERELRLLDVLARQAADLIERKQAEEALKESEMRLQTTLNAARMGAWDLDLQTGAVIWNKQQYKLLGLDWASLKDVPLTPDRLFRYIHPEDSSRAEKRLQAAREGKSDYEDSFRIVRANDGEIRWMARYGRKTKARDGSYSHLSGVMYDITEQKNLERQKDEFIGIASHELKTPVTGITIYAELINGIFREKGDEEHVELSEKLILEINRLVKLINDLLDTTRITKGHLPLNLEEFDLDALIEEIMGSLKFSSSDHQIIFHPPQPLKVRADRNRIHQVITNLLSNAIKYSPDSREVHVMTETTEEGVKVSVKDTGIGIPEELQPKIFNGFSRVSFPHNFPGVGLGLYISSEIIRRHGGRICVESELDKGSVFYFVLPHQIVAEADKTAPVR